MVSISGIYKNGQIKLDKDFEVKENAKVIVTFLDAELNLDKSQGLKLSDFSFAKSRKNLENCKSSFSEDLIEERRL